MTLRVELTADPEHGDKIHVFKSESDDDAAMIYEIENHDRVQIFTLDFIPTDNLYVAFESIINGIPVSAEKAATEDFTVPVEPEDPQEQVNPEDPQEPKKPGEQPPPTGTGEPPVPIEDEASLNPAVDSIGIIGTSGMIVPFSQIGIEADLERIEAIADGVPGNLTTTHLRLTFDRPITLDGTDPAFQVINYSKPATGPGSAGGKRLLTMAGTQTGTSLTFNLTNSDQWDDGDYAAVYSIGNPGEFHIPNGLGVQLRKQINSVAPNLITLEDKNMTVRVVMPNFNPISPGDILRVWTHPTLSGANLHATHTVPWGNHGLIYDIPLPTPAPRAVYVSIQKLGESESNPRTPMNGTFVDVNEDVRIRSFRDSTPSALQTSNQLQIEFSHPVSNDPITGLKAEHIVLVNTRHEGRTLKLSNAQPVLDISSNPVLTSWTFDIDSDSIFNHNDQFRITAININNYRFAAEFLPPQSAETLTAITTTLRRAEAGAASTLNSFRAITMRPNSNTPITGTLGLDDTTHLELGFTNANATAASLDPSDIRVGVRRNINGVNRWIPVTVEAPEIVNNTTYRFPIVLTQNLGAGIDPLANGDVLEVLAINKAGYRFTLPTNVTTAGTNNSTVTQLRRNETEPKLLTAVIDRLLVTLTFNKPLDAGSIPAHSSFSLTYNPDNNTAGPGGTPAPLVLNSQVPIRLSSNGLILTFQVTRVPEPLAEVRLTYTTPGTNMLRDRGQPIPRTVDNIVSFEVTNTRGIPEWRSYSIDYLTGFIRFDFRILTDDNGATMGEPVFYRLMTNQNTLPTRTRWTTVNRQVDLDINRALNSSTDANTLTLHILCKDPNRRNSPTSEFDGLMQTIVNGCTNCLNVPLKGCGIYSLQRASHAGLGAFIIDYNNNEVIIGASSTVTNTALQSRIGMTIEMAHNTGFVRRDDSTALNPFYGSGVIQSNGTATILIPDGMPGANTNMHVRIAGSQALEHFPSQAVSITLPTNANANRWTHTLADFIRYDAVRLGSGLVFETIPGLLPGVEDNDAFYDHARASQTSVVRWRADLPTGRFQWRIQGDSSWNDIIPNQPLPEAIYNPITNVARRFEIQRLGDVSIGVSNAISHTGTQTRYIIATQPAAPTPPRVIARATSTIAAANTLEYLVFDTNRPDGRLDDYATVIKPWTRVTDGFIQAEFDWSGYRIAFRIAATTARPHSRTANATIVIDNNSVPRDLHDLLIQPALFVNLLSFNPDTGRLTINSLLSPQFSLLGYTTTSGIDASMIDNRVHWAQVNTTDIRPYMQINPSGQLTASLNVRIRGNANTPQSLPFRIDIVGSTITYVP
jgi:hypothetical protein